jgi:hypothetical protein
MPAQMLALLPYLWIEKTHTCCNLQIHALGVTLEVFQLLTVPETQLLQYFRRVAKTVAIR